MIKKLKKWVKEKKQKPERFEVKFVFRFSAIFDKKKLTWLLFIYRYNANGDTFFREKGTGEEWKMV